MGRVMLGRELASKFVEAMGLPVDGALAVDVELPIDDIAAVRVTYALTPEAIVLLAEAWRQDAE